MVQTYYVYDTVYGEPMYRGQVQAADRFDAANKAREQFGPGAWASLRDPQEVCPQEWVDS